MKKTRRFAAMVAAMALAATMVAPTMMNASAVANNTITITPGTGDSLTHSNMAAYQIFTGTAGSGADTLNVTGWGSGVTPATFVSSLKDDTTVAIEAKAAVGTEGEDGYQPAVAAQTIKDLFTDAGVTSGTESAENAQKVADILSLIKTDDAKNAVARAAWAAKTSTTSGTFTAASEGSSATITGLDDGYYAVFDTEKAKNANDEGAFTLGLLKVSKSENVNVTTKVSLPTFEKNILDVNDSSATLTKNESGVNEYNTSSNIAWAKDADHDIGDKVPFQLVATIPSNYDKYDDYWLKMHDNLQANVFTLNENDFVVYYVHGDTKTAIASTAYTKTTTGLGIDDKFAGFDDDKTEDFTIEFANLKTAVPEIAAGDKIVVEYSATLTDNAKVGSAGNWNGAYLEYVNNPNWISDGTNTPGDNDKEKTPEDTVVAFTYQTDFTKLDAATGNPLSDAVFALYKKYDTAPTGKQACSESGYTDYYQVGDNKESNESGKFGWIGLDDGEYVLVEVTPPTDANGVSYNQIDPISFTITAEHGNKVLTNLNGVASDATGNATHIDLNSGFVPLENDEDNNATVDYANGKIAASIENSKDTQLPSTGGMGTKLFIAGGGITTTLAAVYLVSKKRSRKEEE